MNDKEGRKWLLQKLYDKGIKYIVFMNGRYFGVNKPPIKYDIKDKLYKATMYKVGLIADLLPDFNGPNYLDIGKYLGIVDWSKVAVDTPVKVRQDDGVVVNRHFEKFESGYIYYFSGGRTSWSGVMSECTTPDNVRLAGGDDEN